MSLVAASLPRVVGNSCRRGKPHLQYIQMLGLGTDNVVCHIPSATG